MISSGFSRQEHMFLKGKRAFIAGVVHFHQEIRFLKGKHAFIAGVVKFSSGKPVFEGEHMPLLRVS